MSANYRRLISYIYAYEGGVKGRNVGFAKLETRNGQCRIQVSVRKIYVGSQDTGVYLLSGNNEILLGRIFLRNGAGEFRTSVPVNNVAGTDQTIDQCYGLTLHSMEDSWQSYTTIWEDAVAHAAEVELSEAVSELLEEKEMQKLPGSCIQEEKTTEAIWKQEESERERPIVDEKAQGLLRGMLDLEELEVQPSQVEPEIQPLQAEPEIQPLQVEPEIQPLQAEPEMQPSKTVPDVQPLQSESDIQPLQEEPAAPAAQEESNFQHQDWERLQRDQLEQLGAQEPSEDVEAAKLWNYFVRTYPKIKPFDYTGGCEILTIKPQDIGLLPREVWTYGNNSFLLHGYYNHRHLILVRLNHQDQPSRFLLGVPGHYLSNEKYMAAMFGFPNFVLSKMQPSGDGRFGYWYTDIRLGNQ